MALWVDGCEVDDDDDEVEYSDQGDSSAMIVALDFFRELVGDKEFEELRSLSIRLHIPSTGRNGFFQEDIITDFSDSYPNLEHLELECTVELENICLPPLRTFTLLKTGVSDIWWAMDYKKKLVAERNWDNFERLVLDTCDLSVFDVDMDILADEYEEKLRRIRTYTLRFRYILFSYYFCNIGC